VSVPNHSNIIYKIMHYFMQCSNICSVQLSFKAK
jgi:hypothetical protein